MRSNMQKLVKVPVFQNRIIALIISELIYVPVFNVSSFRSPIDLQTFHMSLVPESSYQIKINRSPKTVT